MTPTDKWTQLRLQTPVKRLGFASRLTDVTSLRWCERWNSLSPRASEGRTWRARILTLDRQARSSPRGTFLASRPMLTGAMAKAGVIYWRAPAGGPVAG